MHNYFFELKKISGRFSALIIIINYKVVFNSLLCKLLRCGNMICSWLFSFLKILEAKVYVSSLCPSTKLHIFSLIVIIIPVMRVYVRKSQKHILGLQYFRKTGVNQSQYLSPFSLPIPTSISHFHPPTHTHRKRHNKTPNKNKYIFSKWNYTIFFHIWCAWYRPLKSLKKSNLLFIQKPVVISDFQH